ncbi:MAG: ASCH domain-containing protein [archaeon]|nr:ASCH domain-containing protein [Nanoarchaeota archaeon]
MKNLKFHPSLIEKILSGHKVTTWRLFDDKDLTKGDNLIFLNSDTKEEFAKARIVSVKETTFENLTDKDWEGHEKFSSDEEMYRAYQDYYQKKK